MSGASTRPEEEIRIGPIRAAIWPTTRTVSGAVVNVYRVTIEHASKDCRGNIKATNVFDADDLPKVILALKKANDYCLEARHQEVGSSAQEARTEAEPARIP